MSSQQLLDSINYYRIAVWICKTFGYSPFEQSNKHLRPYHPYLFLIYLCDLVFICLSNPVHAVQSIRNGDKVISIFENVIYTLFCTVTLVKVLMILWHKSVISSIKATMDKCVLAAAKDFDDLNQLAAKYRRTYDRTLKPLAVILIVGIKMFSLNGLLQSSLTYYKTGEFVRYMPFNLSYPFSTESTTSYVLCQVQQIYCGISACYTSLSSDLLAYGIVLYYCLHFDIIIMYMKRIREWSGRAIEGVGAMSAQRIHEEREKAFVKIVKYHQTILSLNPAIIRCFEIGIFLNYISSILILCTLGILTMTNMDVYIILRMVVFICFELHQNFIICSFGSSLISLSQNVGIAAYELDWTNYNIRCKKMILLIILRSQKESCVSAIFIKQINFEAFQVIITSASQFYAVLMSLVE